VGRGGSCEMILGVCGTPSRIGVVCIHWGHLRNARPGKFFLHVECPRPPAPRGAAAVLVLDGECGNGHGDVARSVVIVLEKSLGMHGSQLGDANVQVLGLFSTSSPVSYFRGNSYCKGKIQNGAFLSTKWLLLPSRSPGGAIGAVLVGPKVPTRGY
jgi:hypothetical protein